MKAVFPTLVDGGLLGSFIDWRGLPMAYAAVTTLGLIPIDLVVWANANAVTGGLYRSEHKLLPLFKKGFAARVNGISLGKHGRHRTNLWTYPATSKIVFDPFLDSGSTLIAAQNTKRACCGVTDHNASRQR